MEAKTTEIKPIEMVEGVKLALYQTNNNKTEAAKLLDINRTKMYSLLDKLQDVGLVDENKNVKTMAECIDRRSKELEVILGKDRVSIEGNTIVIKPEADKAEYIDNLIVDFSESPWELVEILDELTELVNMCQFEHDYKLADDKQLMFMGSGLDYFDTAWVTENE